MIRLHIVPPILALSGCVLLAGCGGSDHPVLAKVVGTVQYKAQPLEQGTITFHPAKGRAATGKIKDGHILDVTTFAPRDGAAVGLHRVTVVSFDNPDADMYTEKKSSIPTSYSDLNKSKLEVEIQPGENDLTLELTD